MEHLVEADHQRQKTERQGDVPNDIDSRVYKSNERPEELEDDEEDLWFVTSVDLNTIPEDDEEDFSD